MIKANSNGYEGLQPHLSQDLVRLINVLNLRLLDVLRPLNVTVPQYSVMRIISMSGRPFSIGEIAHETVIEQSAVSRVVSQLETRNYVRRSRHVERYKVVEVSLTRDGEQFMAQVLPQAMAILATATSVLTPDENKTLHELVLRVFTNARSMG